MRISLGKAIDLTGIDDFLKTSDFLESGLEVVLEEGSYETHPLIHALVAALGASAENQGGRVSVVGNQEMIPERFMEYGLLPRLGVEVTRPPREPSGRLVPVTQLRTRAQLSDFIVDVIPLLHAEPEYAEPVQYVLSELVGNVLEHSLSPVGAFVCASYSDSDGIISVGVVDAGIGIRSSLSRFHSTESDLEAVTLALKPGTSGTSVQLGGGVDNAGAGLFFTKSIAFSSGNPFFIQSGSGAFRLLPSPGPRDVLINPDPDQDPAVRLDDLGPLNGVAIGIDFALIRTPQFDGLLKEIRTVYYQAIEAGRRRPKKLPRFDDE
jgi:anti-sigma regulatory factor (Ser/Thr protein kinase)